MITEKIIPKVEEGEFTFTMDRIVENVSGGLDMHLTGTRTTHVRVRCDPPMMRGPDELFGWVADKMSEMMETAKKNLGVSE